MLSGWKGERRKKARVKKKKASEESARLYIDFVMWRYSKNLFFSIMLESGSYEKYELRKAVGDRMVFLCYERVWVWKRVWLDIYIFNGQTVLYRDFFVIVLFLWVWESFWCVLYEQREETEGWWGKRRNCGEKEKFKTRII